MRSFSILVGSSLWCNIGGIEMLPRQVKFQYPRRIEPLVQLYAKRLLDWEQTRFSILVGSSLWCNRRGMR